MSEAQPTSAPDEFPNGPCKRGRYYISKSPFSEEQIVTSSHETWVDFGTTLESLRQTAAAQDKRIKELLAQVAAAGLRVQDAETRLNNLREVRRAEKRAELEGDPRIIIAQPGQLKGR